MSNSLAIRVEDIAPTTWSMLKEQAIMLVDSGFLPVSIKKPQQAMAVMLKGRELGIPPMQAFAHISVINGKPAIGAELMLSLIRRVYPKAPIRIKRREDDGCTILAGRPGDKDADLTAFTFTINDAKRAGLLGKTSWIGYPKNMCFWRAISDMARSLYPECLMGCSHTPEELGAEVNEDGEVIDVAPSGGKADVVYEAVIEDDPPPVAEPPRPVPPAPAPPTAATEPRKAGIYRGTPEQQKIIEEILLKWKVPGDLWDAVHEGLLDRPSTDVKAVVDQVKAAAKNRAAAEVF